MRSIDYVILLILGVLFIWLMVLTARISNTGENLGTLSSPTPDSEINNSTTIIEPEPEDGTMLTPTSSPGSINLPSPSAVMMSPSPATRLVSPSPASSPAL